MREHTPGPWYVAPDGLIMSKKGVIIGTVHTCADDYLIAAAPDLLEAAKETGVPVAMEKKTTIFFWQSPFCIPKQVFLNFN